LDLLSALGEGQQGVAAHSVGGCLAGGPEAAVFVIAALAGAVYSGTIGMCEIRFGVLYSSTKKRALS
jgi:hypothetical protein